ncbi:hypothetical protein G9A89_006034 [Geosiphon pyriformis]|nr:hypothetical protein G9A89_006034 [Geosiphon pyriformis]
MASKDLSSVIVAGGMLLVGVYSSSWLLGVVSSEMVAMKNWELVDELPLPISSSVESFSVFGFYWVVSFGAVFGFVGVDRLFVAAVIDKSLVAAVDRLELDTPETDRWITASLVGKWVGFDLGTDLEFGTAIGVSILIS